MASPSGSSSLLNESCRRFTATEGGQHHKLREQSPARYQNILIRSTRNQQGERLRTAVVGPPLLRYTFLLELRDTAVGSRQLRLQGRLVLLAALQPSPQVREDGGLGGGALAPWTHLGTGTKGAGEGSGGRTHRKKKTKKTLVAPDPSHPVLVVAPYIAQGRADLGDLLQRLLQLLLQQQRQAGVRPPRRRPGLLLRQHLTREREEPDKPSDTAHVFAVVCLYGKWKRNLLKRREPQLEGGGEF